MKISQVSLHIQQPGRRGGVNLANRHARLLKKNGQGDKTSLSNYESPSSPKLNSRSIHPGRRYFQGILIPQKPIPPSADECCMSNCRPCVHDVYLSSLAQYKIDRTQLRNILEQQNVPMHTWPSEIIQHYNYQVSSNLESQYDLAETKALYAAQEAKRIMTTTTLPTTVSGSARDHITGGKNVLFEAGKLVFWVLKGCPG